MPHMHDQDAKPRRALLKALSLDLLQRSQDTVHHKVAAAAAARYVLCATRFLRVLRAMRAPAAFCVLAPTALPLSGRRLHYRVYR